MICFFTPIRSVFATGRERLVIPPHYVVSDQDTLWFLKPYVLKNQNLEKDPALRLIPLPTNESFYDTLRAVAYQNFLTKMLHDWFINKPDDYQMNEPDRRNFFKYYEGRKIGYIYIVQLAPFGADFNSPDRPATTWAGRTANHAHVKTRVSFIKKSLLFKSGESLSSFILTENERILREYPFIRDVRIVPVARFNDPSIVDLTVMVKDVFSFGIDISNTSYNKTETKIYNKNVLGVGQELSLALLYNNQKIPQTGYDINYYIRNIGGTFADLTIDVGNNYNRRGVGVSLEKDFKTIKTKWAGGASVWVLKDAYRVSDSDPIISKNPLGFNYQEYWLGRSFPLNDAVGEKASSLILSNLIEIKHFNERPDSSSEMAYYYSNSFSFYGGLSFSKWSHVQNNLIYGFGRTEDIPIGMLLEGVAGYDKNEFLNRGYGHLFFSTGHFLSPRMNYLYCSAGFGGFYNKRNFQQGIFDFTSQYFSRLFYLMGLKSRQFFALYYTVGIHRFNPEGLFVDNDKGIRDFLNSQINNTQRFTFRSETVLFHYQSILNFKLASFYFSDFSLLGHSGAPLNEQKLYVGVGMGVRIMNEALVFRTIELSGEVFPSRPGGMKGFGFTLKGELRPLFNNFAGRKPLPLVFK